MSNTGQPWPAVRWVAIGLVVLVVLWTRISGAMHLEIINDEMHHLKSFRNRYGTSDIYPLFLERLEASGRLSPERVELVKRVYHAGPLVQRGLIALVDPQPPAYPVSAQVLQVLSRDSLTALRALSVIASLVAVGLAWALGRELCADRTRGEALGGWLAGLLGIGALSQYYGAIARPYAVAQCLLLALLYVFCREVRAGHRSPWRLLLIALAAQATQWALWPVAGPLVLYELVRRRLGGAGVWTLVRQTWWYALASVLLLAVLLVQMKNPTVASQSGFPGFGALLRQLSIGSPFSHLGSFGDAALLAGGVAFLLLAGWGVVVLLTSRDYAAAPRWGLVAAFVGTCVAMLVLGSAVRFMVTYAVLPLGFAGIAATHLLGTASRAYAGLALLVLAFGGLAVLHPEDPYERIDDTGTPFSQVAARLEAELRPGDALVVFPPNWANCLYRLGEFPEPLMPLTQEGLGEALRRQSHVRRLVYSTADPAAVPELQAAARRWEYRNGHAIYELPPG